MHDEGEGLRSVGNIRPSDVGASVQAHADVPLIGGDAERELPGNRLAVLVRQDFELHERLPTMQGWYGV